MSTKPARLLLLLALPCLASADAPVLRGPYAVKHTVVHVPGLQISSGKVDVYYATNATTPQRFIAFAHGAGGGQFIQPFVYKSILTSLASWGFVIGAARACLEGYCGDHYYKQQLILIDWARKAGAGGDKIMGLVNFTGGVGVSGHSMGGGSTLKDSTADFAAAHGIGAAVMLHAYTHDYPAPTVPFLAFTGTADTTAPAAMTEKFYAAAANATPALPRGIVNKVGAAHQEPSDYKNKAEPYNPLMAQYMAAWFKLYLDGWTEATPGGTGAVNFDDMIYGTGPTSICTGGDGDMGGSGPTTCEMQRGTRP